MTPFQIAMGRVGRDALRNALGVSNASMTRYAMDQSQSGHRFPSIEKCRIIENIMNGEITVAQLRHKTARQQ